MKNSIKSLLKEVQKQERIVSIFFDSCDQTSCSVGIIDTLTDNEVRLNSITPDGEFDGQEVRQLYEIIRVDYDGLYEKKIELLWNNRNKIIDEFFLKKKSGVQNLIIDTIEQAQSNNFIVEIWSDDEDNSIVGYIKKIEKDLIEISSIDDYGREDGTININPKIILSVDCGNRKCQKLSFLHEIQKKGHSIVTV